MISIGSDSPHDVALEQDLRHGAHVDVVDLADLRQLQGRRRPREQEADDDEDRVVQDAHGHVLGREREDGRHDQGRQQHPRDQGRDDELALLLGILHVLDGFLGEGVAGEIRAQDDEDQRDGDLAVLVDGAGDRVAEEGSLVEEQALQGWYGRHDDGRQHRPQGGVHEVPHALHEGACPGGHGRQPLLYRGWKSVERRLRFLMAATGQTTATSACRALIPLPNTLDTGRGRLFQTPNLDTGERHHQSIGVLTGQERTARRGAQ